MIVTHMGENLLLVNMFTASYEASFKVELNSLEARNREFLKFTGHLKGFIHEKKEFFLICYIESIHNNYCNSKI